MMVPAYTFVARRSQAVGESPGQSHNMGVREGENFRKCQAPGRAFCTTGPCRLVLCAHPCRAQSERPAHSGTAIGNDRFVHDLGRECINAQSELVVV
jgi:hypothetical protein